MENSLIMSIVAILVAIVSLVVNIFVAIRIARLGRENSMAIATMTTSITERQLELSRHSLVANLAPRRAEVTNNIVDAIRLRRGEIATNKYFTDEFETAALSRWWNAGLSVPALFDDDVVNRMNAIEQLLAELDDATANLESDQPANRAASERLRKINNSLDRKVSELRAAMDGHSYLGHVRETRPAIVRLQQERDPPAA